MDGNKALDPTMQRDAAAGVDCVIAVSSTKMGAGVYGARTGKSHYTGCRPSDIVI